jgi:hypothetical protein
MLEAQKEDILEKAKLWFKESIAENHIKNTKKLKDSSMFIINPFTAVYLSSFLTGDTSPESIAKALIYPRVLGTSISTTFGSQIQKFTNTVLDGFASTTSGIDIEFIDQIDSRKKYCQLKAGPNTINKDDVVTIDNHFKKIKGLARQNGMKLDINDLVVGIVYGEKEQVSGHYKSLENNHNYSLLVGPEFWERLTGDNNFYNDLLSVITDVAKEADFKSELEEIIKELAKDEEIIKLADH